MKISRSTFDKVMFPCYNPMSMVIKKAHGVNVYDTEGNKYIDLTSGIAVNCLGHTPRGVQKVIKKVSSKLIHCSNILTGSRRTTCRRTTAEPGSKSRSAARTTRK